MSVTVRIMMIRSVLHAIATIVALVLTFVIFAKADMPTRMAMYALGWMLCGAAYLLLLYCKQCVLDAIDARIQHVLQVERTVEELRRYQRQLRFVARWRAKRKQKKE